MLFSDKDNCFNIVLTTVEIIEEYIIWGICTKKSEYPLSIYILCIVLSEKNKAFTAKYKEKETKNNDILSETKLKSSIGINVKTICCFFLINFLF